jgi:hypothetical protein
MDLELGNFDGDYDQLIMMESMYAHIAALQAQLALCQKYESQLHKCTDLMEKNWPASMSCNGLLQVAGHLDNVFKELALCQWIPVEYGRLDRGLPEIADGHLINSDIVFITKGTVESTETSFYNHEEKEWQGEIKHPTHFRPISLPATDKGGVS